MQSKKLLVLDLDSTLIYSETYQCTKQYDFFGLVKTINTFPRVTQLIGVVKRKGLDDFLEYCFSHYDVLIWSASDRGYINFLLENILKPHMRPKDVWCFRRCGQKDEYITKPLKKVWRRKSWSYKRTGTLVVDDNRRTYVHNRGNAVPINPFKGKHDNELLRIRGLLMIIKDEPDVREIEKNPGFERYLQFK